MDKMSQFIARDVGVAKVLAYSGIALVISLIVAQGFLMGFIPPPSPALSAEELAQIFIDRKIGIRIGTMIECIGFTFWGTWAISIVVCMRRMERGIPVLTYASIANAGGAWVFFLLMPITWAMIAFRPETMDPKFIQIMNDYVWFIFILSWPPFAVFMIFIATAIFRDHNVPTIYPRWVAFQSLVRGAHQSRGTDRVRQDRALCLRRADLVLVHLHRLLRLDRRHELRDDQGAEPRRGERAGDDLDGPCLERSQRDAGRGGGRRLVAGRERPPARSRAGRGGRVAVDQR